MAEPPSTSNAQLIEYDALFLKTGKMKPATISEYVLHVQLKFVSGPGYQLPRVRGVQPQVLCQPPAHLNVRPYRGLTRSCSPIKFLGPCPRLGCVLASLGQSLAGVKI